MPRPVTLEQEVGPARYTKRMIADLAVQTSIAKFRNFIGLALQLSFGFEVRALSGRLVSSTPERPCDDMCGLDSLSSESDGDAADFLD